MNVQQQCASQTISKMNQKTNPADLDLEVPPLPQNDRRINVIFRIFPHRQRPTAPQPQPWIAQNHHILGF